MGLEDRPGLFFKTLRLPITGGLPTLHATLMPELVFLRPANEHFLRGDCFVFLLPPAILDAGLFL